MLQFNILESSVQCITYFSMTRVDQELYTQPAYNLGPLSARQRNAIQMAFRWRSDSGPILRAYCTCTSPFVFRCYLSKAHCKDTTIDLAYHGACNFTYTRPTRDPIQGAVIVNDFLCAFLSHRSCQDTFEPTCGTDGVSYKNL